MDRNEIIAVVEGDSKDWVNKFPDCILSYILSILRIKDAVDTCLISRGWRDLWKGPILTRPNLEFDIPNIFGSKYARLIEKHEEKDRLAFLVDRFDRQCFVRRVNKLLELYSGNKVESLRVAFFFDVESTAILDKWIRFAIAKGAKVLDLHLLNSTHWDYAEFYVFPHWILSELNNASALKHLSLHRCVLKPPTDFNRLAQLTTLCLNKVFVDPGFLEHLFSICVLLEGLTLIKCRVRLSNLIIGPSLHLRDLKVLECNKLEKIEIDAVNLSSFEYDGIIFDISCMRTPHLVRFFFRGCSVIYGLPYAFTLLALCPALETLHLQLYTELENIPQTVPTFGNLKQMNLDLFPPNFDLSSVLNILKAAPLMEEFIITVRSSDYEGEMRNISGFSHNCLKKVKMQGFQGKWLEIELAICILKIATKLEVMVIDPLGKFYKGGGSWIDFDCSYYVEGNEDKDEDVEPHEEMSNGNEDRDEGEDLEEATETCHKEVGVEGGREYNNEIVNEDGGVDVEEESEHENEDESLDAREMNKDKDENDNNEIVNEDGGVDVEEGSEHENEDESLDAREMNKDKDENDNNEFVNEDGGVDVEEGSEHQNEDESLDAREMNKDKDENDDKDDEKTYELLHWQRRGRAVVQERLEEIKTHAQVIIL